MACKYCWHPRTGEHNQGCPELDGSGDKWQQGYNAGYADFDISVLDAARYYSRAFALGFRVGRNDINALIDLAQHPGE